MSEPTSKPPQYDIFVSYSHGDAKRVQLLADALEVEGWRVFWDKTIPAGEDWESFIGVNLDAAPVVIAVWSTASVKSRFVRDEVSRADKRGVLVPVIIDDVEPMFGFGSIHASNLVEWLASGGGKLPDHLRTSIRRKSSSARPAVPTIDDRVDRHPRAAKEAATEFTSPIRERKPEQSAVRTSAASGTSGEYIPESPQLGPTTRSSVRKGVLVASAATFALLVAAFGLWSWQRPPGLAPAPSSQESSQESKQPGPSIAQPSAPPASAPAPPSQESSLASKQPGSSIAQPSAPSGPDPAPPSEAPSIPTPAVIAPPTTPTTPNVRMACSTSADAVLAPILALFRAWEQLDVELYLAQWGPDAIARSKDYARKIADLAPRRREDFAKFRVVKVIGVNPRIDSADATTAKVSNTYSMQFTRADGRVINETGVKESYVLECLAKDHSWRIRENIDYQ